MALTFHLDIVSNEALIFSGPATRLVVPGRAGELCVLARHAPLLTELRPGLARFADPFDRPTEIFLSSGYLEVQPDSVTILADTVLRTDDMDENAARAAVERTRSAMAAQLEKADYEKLKAELNMELALLRAIDQIRRQTKP
jgi:F-type H+-transporting ATPase subunit epsilon